ncbi:MAG: murein biosynthesis integral membrane protein MurJ [Bacilli bacterium]
MNMVKSIVIMIIFSIGSRCLGFIREMLIASRFGSGMETDTFFIALTAINLVTTMIYQCLNTTMIPVLSEIENKELSKNNYTNKLLNNILLFSIILVILGWFISPLIIKVLAAGFKGEQFYLAIKLMRIGLPAIILAVFIGIYRGYLQSELMFTEFSASLFPYNLTYIFFLIFLSGYFGITGLMVTSVIAVGSQIVIQLPGLKKVGYQYRFILDFKDKYIKKLLLLSIPVIISVAVNDLNMVIDKSLASTLIEGSISALNYSSRLNSLVLTVFITAIATVLFPMLTSEVTTKNHEGFKRLISNGVNVILLITIPATIGIIVLAQPIVKIAFERGAFDPVATKMTSAALLFYSLGLVGMALRMFLERAYYSLQDMKTPMINGIITVGLNITLNFILIRYMEHRGLALATSIAITITTVFLFYRLTRKIGSIGGLNIVKCGIKSLGASLVMGIFVYLLYNFLNAKVLGNTLFELLVLLITVAVGAGVYFVIVYLLKVDEISWFIKLFKKKLYR